MFTEQLNAIFADYITDGVINCEPDVFKNGLDKILQEYTPKESTVGKRLPSNFMVWMKTIRHTIIEEFFSEFDSYSDWSKEGTIEYYKHIGLPLDKLELLINKKERQGKTTFKPKILSLITTKAGQIWSTLDDTEKAKYKMTENTSIETDNVEIIEPSLNSNKKKGRPKGKCPKNSVSDDAIMKSIQLMNTLNNVDEEVDINVEPFEFEGEQYYKDDLNNIYSLDDNKKIGKLNDGDLELFEK